MSLPGFKTSAEPEYASRLSLMAFGRFPTPKAGNKPIAASDLREATGGNGRGVEVRNGFTSGSLLSYTRRPVTHFPNSVVTADGRLEPVATALHEMMSRQLIYRKEDSID